MCFTTVQPIPELPAGEIQMRCPPDMGKKGMTLIIRDRIGREIKVLP
jgi:hypothetical protein